MDRQYRIVIERKRNNKNTYLRIKEDLSIYVTTNYRTKEREIEEMIEKNQKQIEKMIARQRQKNERKQQFYFLGKPYDIVYSDQKGVFLGDAKVFCNRQDDLDKWYKKQAQTIFSDHLNEQYQQFSENIPYPSLRIRKMTTRWGVCNTKTKVITLNLELIKQDTKYLDYVIVHELSHLVYPNHSIKFWQVVQKNYPMYQKVRKEMKEY